MVKLVPNPQLNLHLPEPNSEQLEVSSLLVNEIISAITLNDNWLSFQDYMNLALYHPLYGYYTAGNRKIGADGDFVTAPTLGNLFAHGISQQIQELLTTYGNFDILEFGAGTGKLAHDLLLELESSNTPLNKYYILEVSAELKDRQQQTLNALPTNIRNKIIWLDTLPEDNSFQGIIIANEVIDAMPVHLFTYEDNATLEVGLSVVENQIIWQSRLPEVHLENYIEEHIQPYILHTTNYLSEVNLIARSWLQTVSQCLAQGAMLIVDYGFARHEYYHEDRELGTLMCHYQHYAHQDPLFHPGLQDITAHVDFTSLAEVAVDNEMDVCAYLDQAHFLLANNVTQYIDNNKNDANIFKLKQELKILTSPAEMGELFKVLLLSKNIDPRFFDNLEAFDRRGML